MSTLSGLFKEVYADVIEDVITGIPHSKLRRSLKDSCLLKDYEEGYASYNDKKRKAVR